MGKEAKYCQGKDAFERMNYLYQASHMISLKNRVAASYYGSMMMGCAKKAVLRVEPNLKRTICKQCNSPLIPGETARVRLCSKRIKGVKWTCLICLNSKMYPTKKGYKLWIEQPEAIVETLHFIPKKKSIDCDKSNVKDNNKTESTTNTKIKNKSNNNLNVNQDKTECTINTRIENKSDNNLNVNQDKIECTTNTRIENKSDNNLNVNQDEAQSTNCTVTNIV